MIEGFKTVLVAYEPEYWSIIQKWMSDPVYKYYFRNIPEIPNKAQLMNWPQLMNMNVLMVVAKDVNQIVGMVTWDNIRLLARSCDFGMIIDKEFQSKGYSKDALMCFLDYLISRLGFHKVSAKIAKSEIATNEKLRKFGFKDELVLRDEFYMNGKWHDDIKYSAIDYEFKQMFKDYLNGDSIWAEKVAAEAG